MSKSIYEEALQELKDATTDLKDLEIIHSYDVSKIKTALEQAQKQEKLLDMYREYFRLNRVPKGEWTTLLFNRLLEVQKIIKELENE